MEEIIYNGLDITQWVVFHTSPDYNSQKGDISLEEYYYTKWNNFRERPVAPLSVTVNITQVCNLRCEHCSRKNELQNRELTKEKFFSIMQKLKSAKVSRVVLTGGEPLLHRDILEIVRALKNNGFRVQILSNLMVKQSLLCEILNHLDKYDELQVSIDGVGAVYEQIRKGGSFSRLCDNLMLLQKCKCTYRVNMVVTKMNYHQMYDVLNIAENYGATGIRFTPFFGDITSKLQVSFSEIMCEFCEVLKKYKRDHRSIPILSDPVGLVYPIYANLRRIDKSFLHQTSEFLCPACTMGMELDIDGNAIPCSYFNKTMVCGGNIYEKSIEDIWSSEEFEKFRNIDVDDPQCNACSEKSNCNGGCKAARFLYSKSVKFGSPECLGGKYEYKR